jgi:ribose transport system permease protein
MTSATPDAALETGRFGLGRLTRLSGVRDYGIVFSFVALFITLSFASNVFFTHENLLNILDQWSATAIIAVGGTLVFIAGGFDLSVGSIYAVAGVVASLTAPHIGAWGAILLGVGMGLGCGVVNGILTTVGRINPFIATLATSIIIAGIALVLTSGNLITVLTPVSFTTLGRGHFAGVKYSVWTLLAFTLVCGFLLARTTFGRMMYASGGNPEAARLSGIRVNLVRASTFAISGTAAGIAGVIVTSRVATGQADSGGLGIALDAVAGIVIGGTSIMGGAGAVWRTILGVLLLAMIGNGFNLLNVNSTYQRIFQGAIILFAVGVDAWSRRSS